MLMVKKLKFHENSIISVHGFFRVCT